MIAPMNNPASASPRSPKTAAWKWLAGAAALPLFLAAGPTPDAPQHHPGAVVKQPTTDQSPAHALEALPGLQIELLLNADPQVNGSRLNQGKGPQGLPRIGRATG